VVTRCSQRSPRRKRWRPECALCGCTSSTGRRGRASARFGNWYFSLRDGDRYRRAFGSHSWDKSLRQISSSGAKSTSLLGRKAAVVWRVQTRTVAPYAEAVPPRDRSQRSCRRRRVQCYPGYRCTLGPRHRRRSATRRLARCPSAPGMNRTGRRSCATRLLAWAYPGGKSEVGR
jgi:hypothetical protein